jgi:hypothetical protein
LKVFISYTGQDLAAHANVVVASLRRMEWVAVDHRDWAPTGRPSVQACREKLAECSVMVLLVAHRYGWVPPRENGGDGQTSITQMEYEWAREFKMPIVPFVAESEDGWQSTWIERHENPAAAAPLASFKAELREHIVAFFTSQAESVQEKLEIGLRAAADQISRDAAQPEPRGEVLPAKLPYLCDRSQQSRLIRQRLQGHLASRGTRPLLLVVHGNADEAHRAFVERVEGHMLPEVLAQTGGRRESRFFYLPALDVDAATDFGAALRLEMSNKIPQAEFANDQELLACLRILRVRGVCVVLQVCASECRRDPAKILQTVVDYWRRVPDFPRDLLATCILCVKYDERPSLKHRLFKMAGRKTAASSMRLAVESLAAALDREPHPETCVLPELKSITPRDVQEWLVDTRKSLPRHVPDAEVDRMFDEKPSLPMDDAIKHLENVLQNQPRD